MTCNREASSVEEARQRWADQVEFVGVAWSGDPDQYRSFIDRYGLSFPQIDDTTAEVFTRFQLLSQPAIAIVLPDGEVQMLLGAVDGSLLDAIITDGIG